MKRVVLALLVSLAALAIVPLAQASDASLRHALTPYKTRLTADISYLANFSAPSRGAAPATLRKLSNIRNDLAGASSAATGQKGSTRSGRRGRTLILSGLHDAIVAAGDAQTSARAARAGHRSSARRAARAEQTEINKGIPMFEQGGTLLHLY